MAKFNLDDYEPVDVRLKRFLTDHDNGRVTTELVSDPAMVFDVAVFKAYIYDGDTLLATGYAMERPDDGYVNKTSHVENCETSAIGRGLANMGLSGDKRASREEIQKVERMTATETERVQKGREQIHALLNANVDILATKYVVAINADMDAAKTVADMKAVWVDVSETVKRERDAERKALATESTVTATDVNDARRAELDSTLAKLKQGAEEPDDEADKDEDGQPLF